MKNYIFPLILVCVLFFSCGPDDESTDSNSNPPVINTSMRLASFDIIQDEKIEAVGTITYNDQNQMILHEVVDLTGNVIERYNYEYNLTSTKIEGYEQVGSELLLNSVVDISYQLGNITNIHSKSFSAGEITQSIAIDLIYTGSEMNAYKYTFYDEDGNVKRIINGQLLYEDGNVIRDYSTQENSNNVQSLDFEFVDGLLDKALFYSGNNSQELFLNKINILSYTEALLSGFSVEQYDTNFDLEPPQTSLLNKTDFLDIYEYDDSSCLTKLTVDDVTFYYRFRYEEGEGNAKEMFYFGEEEDPHLKLLGFFFPLPK